MRTTVAGMSAPAAYEKVSDFGSFPELTDVIRELEMTTAADGAELSSWEVSFYEGVMRWTERDVRDAAALTIEFEQTTGDLDAMHGSWRVEPSSDGAVVVFESFFDLGMPAVADILDPVAFDAFANTIGALLTGLFGAGLDFAVAVDGTARQEVRA